ncbi:MAG: fumarylacetoacetate hydrolase family protein, partial [Candidatus Limnocylindrales bacterium]
NYPAPGARSARPLVYAKLPGSVSAHGALLTWDRSLTSNVDAEAELGVVIGIGGRDIRAETALEHVFGYTCINDISSRDPWLDGDQWLLGKSMPGFCPVGPWVVTRDEIETGARAAPSGPGPWPDLGLGCTINGQPIQDGRSGGMGHSIDALIAYLSRHVELQPGDLIATGTPARLAGPPGPERHLRAGDTVSVRIDQIGELTTRIG